MSKKKHEEHVNLERWLVSYADFITLLFAFFTVMYAISQADIAKLKNVTKSIRDAFAGNPPSAMINTSKMGGKDLNDFTELMKGHTVDTQIGKNNLGADAETEQLVSLASIMEEAFKLLIDTNEIANQEILEMMPIADEGLTIRLVSAKLFEGNSDQIRKDFYPILDKIVGILKWTKFKIRIEGHTDDTKPPAKYDSNWEFSAAKATSVLRYFIEKHKFDPDRVFVGAYADTKPLTTNETERGRLKNRRVDIVILKRK